MSNTATEVVEPPSDFEGYNAWRDLQEKPAAKVEEKPAAVAAVEDEDDEDEEEEEPAAPLTPQKKSGFQRRVDKLNQDKGALQARIAELERAQAEKTEKPAAAAAAEPAGKPVAANFETYEEYIEKLTDWKLEQRDAQRQAAAKQEAFQKAWKESAARSEALHDDFQAKIAEQAELPLSGPLMASIVNSENGPEICYYLATHPEEAARISKMDDQRKIERALGRIEASFEEDAEEEKPAPKARVRVTQAPPPAKTVRGVATPGEPDPLDYEAWKKKRELEPGARNSY